MADLSPRELQVVQLVTKGLSNKQIGNALGVTEGTIKQHLHSIYTKRDVSGRVSLAVAEMRNNPQEEVA